MARKLLKRKNISQLWIVNGKIRVKDKTGNIHETNTLDAFSDVVSILDPTFKIDEH